MRTIRSKTCNQNRFDSSPYVVRSTIGYHSNNWASCYYIASA